MTINPEDDTNRPEHTQMDSIGTALSARNWPRTLECLVIAAHATAKAEAYQAGIFLENLDAFCRQLADGLAVDLPVTSDPIGFDRPTNIHLVTEIYPSGGHRRLIEQAIAALPNERHIVLFTGALEKTRDFGLKTIVDAGGFPIYPDASLDHFDRLLWLREKLATFVARRLFVFHHPQDVLATVALAEFAGRYGPRAYVVHHADTVTSLGVDLTDATHLAIRPEQRQRILDLRPDYPVHLLPLSYAPELLDPPISPAIASRIASGDHEFLSNGTLTTATCGGGHKFRGEGPLSLASILANILMTTRGRHYHIGPLSAKMKSEIQTALTDAGQALERLVFVGEVHSVAEALAANHVDLFVTSFPVGGGLTVVEAAYAGLPIAVYGGASDEVGRYISGVSHTPDDVVVWETPEDLEETLRSFWKKDGIERLERMAEASRLWAGTRHSGAKFRRRLLAVIRVTERAVQAPLEPERRRVAEALLDRDYYLHKHRDVAKVGIDPVKHFLSHGEAELRPCNALFDPKFYLSQLTGPERKVAAKRPLTHYVMRGEARGYRPHPLFDPAFCRISLQAAGLWEEPTGESLADCILLRYLHSDHHIAPHMFFDPLHYGRQAELVPQGQSLLTHFLETGMADGLSPHPLLRPELIRAGGGDLSNAIVDYLTRSGPRIGEASPTRLFNAAKVPDELLAHYAKAAPNLLWAHLIEGNQTNRDPHVLISVQHVARMRPDTLVSATAIICHMAINRLGVDTHPLVVGRHILKQAPYAESLPISLTQYFLESGAAHNIDPHPFFSTQYYLYNNPDVGGASVNPLVHYLQYGQYEGRLSHPAFDGNFYYQRWLKNSGGGSPILDYFLRGMALFRSALPMDDTQSRMARKMAVGLFDVGSDTAAGDMLAASLHPDMGPRHPSLITETRALCCTTEDAEETTEIYGEEQVLLDRPSIAAQVHIAPPIGEYLAPAAMASLYSDAILVPGNDGFIAQSGRWIDYGLSGFDPDIMQIKENGAVAAVSEDKVLLRRFASDISLPSGILASGTYSHNYFHFLLEILPRILLAADIAPAGTPILADSGMPDQHYQALRLYLPDHPVLRLSRHSSIKIGRLYVGSMPNTIQDAFGHDMPPADAVRFHPAVIRRLAGPGLDAVQTDSPRHLYLRRDSTVRRLLNAGEIDAALSERGFESVRCAALPFSEQVSLFSQVSGGIVAQSGAHLANILFAPKGTRVFALFSNAPGTNFYLWSALGALLGHEVINIAGWRIVGTVANGGPEAHESFTVPVTLVTPFFPLVTAETGKSDPLAEARAQLDALHAACTQADTLTSSWSIRSRPTPEGFDAAMITARRKLGTLLDTLPCDQIAELMKHPFFTDFSRNIRSGFVALRDHDAKELEIIAEIEASFEELSTAAITQDDDTAEDLAPSTGGAEGFERTLALAMLYIPAWKLPLVASLDQIETDCRSLYLRWLATPPYLFRDGDDAGYVAFTGRLLNWLSRHLDPETETGIRKQVMQAAGQLDLGQLLLVDAPLRSTLEARNRLLEQVALRDGPQPRTQPRPDDLSQGRIRVGILCRTFVKGPDSEAVVAFFNAFDRSRFEIFAYSVGFRDRVVAADEEFDQIFDAKIDHRRVVSNGPHDIREKILADDLDVFLYANATTFGVREQERALYHRVAPVQVTLNSHLPVSPGFPSFDYYLTGRSDDPAAEVSDADYLEKILRADGSVINYLNSLKPKPRPSFDRAALGLSDDDVVMMNGGSSQKLRSECLRTMLRALQAVPKGKLLLAPYNPGWAARSQAFAFNRQLRDAAEAVGVSMDRIIVLGELSVAEAEAALSLSDIYLTSFPHGGATMTHLALIYGTPPVVLRRRDTRSIDQFLVSSLGFPQMLASTPDAYVDLVSKLAQDLPRLRELSVEIKTAARHPVFVANPDFSQAMQAALQQALQTAREGDADVD